MMVFTGVTLVLTLIFSVIAMGGSNNPHTQELATAVFIAALICLTLFTLMLTMVADA